MVSSSSGIEGIGVLSYALLSSIELWASSFSINQLRMLSFLRSTYLEAQLPTVHGYRPHLNGRLGQPLFSKRNLRWQHFSSDGSIHAG
jgi:hypothetical protein